MIQPDEAKEITEDSENMSTALEPAGEPRDKLAWFDTAYSLLQKCVTVDEVKEIYDKALALQTYLRQSKQSLEMQNMAAEIRIRAQRRGGALIAQMPKNPGGQSEHESYLSQPGTGRPAKLSDLGLSRNQSSRWQMISEIPDTEFERHIEEVKESEKELTSSGVLDFARYLKREQERRHRREEAFKEASRFQPDGIIHVIEGDFREVLTDDDVSTGSVSLVITDLPYGKDHLDLWDSLGELSHRILKEGGILAVYSGCANLPRVLESLEKHLAYCWTAALVYGVSNGESAGAFADTIFFPIRVKNLWKPVILFSKGKPEPSAHESPSQRYLKDVITGDGWGALDKRNIPWQQGEREAAYLIETLTGGLPGALICDPCCGSGTNALAVKKLNTATPGLNFRFIGCDTDSFSVGETHRRLSEVKLFE